MGRNANPIDYEVPTRGRLAELLRAEKAGKTYDELATLTGMSAATLKRAASGKVVPSEKVIDAFLAACGSGPRTVRTAKGLRRQARRDEHGGHTRVLAATVNTRDTLADALDALYRNAGAPTYREMQMRAGGSYMLPLSSISRILHRQMLPVDEKQMVAFLRGCHVPQREHAEWVNAWRRAVGRGSNSLSHEAFVEALHRASSEVHADRWAATWRSVLVALEGHVNSVRMPELTAGMASVVAAAEKQLDMSGLASRLPLLTEAAAEAGRHLTWSGMPRNAAAFPPGALGAAA